MRRLILATSLLAPISLAPLVVSAPAFAAEAAHLGDLSKFNAIASDTLALLHRGDLPAAKKRITDFETAWDVDASRLRALDPDQWGVIDDAADASIAALRAKKPVLAQAENTVTGLIATLH